MITTEEKELIDSKEGLDYETAAAKITQGFGKKKRTLIKCRGIQYIQHHDINTNNDN